MRPALEQAAINPRDLPLFVRIIVDRGTLADGASAWDALDARVTRAAERAVPVLVALRDDISEDRVDAWRATARAVVERYRGRVAGLEIAVPPGGAPPPPDVFAFTLRSVAVATRSIDPTVQIVQGLPAPDVARQRALFARDTDAFVDAIAVNTDIDAAGEASTATQREFEALVRDRDPTALVLMVGQTTGAAPTDVGRWLTFALSRLGEPHARVGIAATATGTAAILRAAATLKDVLAGELMTLDPNASGLAITDDGRNVTPQLQPRLLYSLTNFSTYLVLPSAPPGQATVLFAEPSGRRPVVRDPIRGTVTPVANFDWSADTKVLRFRLPSTATEPVIVDFNYGAETVFVSRTEAAATTLPSVAEIVFRHQQRQAQQDALYRAFDAAVRMEQRFRATATESFLVVSENRLYVAPDAVEWEELSFSVNGGRWGPDRPEFPLLQAEKVLSLPLDLRLTDDYRYTLDGVDDVDGRRAFVVSFEPLEKAAARYRGRLWIDAETYVRLRLNTIQTGLRGEITSSEEVHVFRPVADVRGEPLFLPARVDTTQQILIAGRTILLEKAVTFSDHRIDPPDFDAKRTTARQSDRIMMRETPVGLRYLVKQNGERVVSDRMTLSSRALAMGTTLDPSFDFPLPIFGLNYLDFDAPGGSQFALLFGGVLALGNLQKPRIGGRPIDGSIDFFAMAAPSASSMFDADGERRGERVMTMPFSGGVNVGYQIDAFHQVRAGYQLRYDVYFGDGETDPAFRPPADSATHGLTAEYKFSRRGYTLAATFGGFRRQGWRPWGFIDRAEPAQAAYRRYSATAAKDFRLSTFQTFRASVAWYGGRSLDRFSMYQFGLFDEVRMHGVPASGVRFPELVLGRASYSFNLLDIYRIDLFLDRAAGRDPDDRTTWHAVTGTGVAVNFRAPWHTMLRMDVGKSVVPARYAGAGSWTLQVLLLKPLR